MRKGYAQFIEKVPRMIEHVKNGLRVFFPVRNISPNDAPRSSRTMIKANITWE